MVKIDESCEQNALGVLLMAQVVFSVSLVWHTSWGTKEDCVPPWDKTLLAPMQRDMWLVWGGLGVTTAGPFDGSATVFMIMSSDSSLVVVVDNNQLLGWGAGFEREFTLTQRFERGVSYV